MSPSSESPAARPRLRARHADFAMLYRELHYCYGRLIGLDGIALWSWYRLHQHGGGRCRELTGYGWTSQRAIMQAHGLSDHVALRRKLDLLIEAGLLELRQAQEVLGDAEIERLRAQAQARGERLSLQKRSHLAFVHDPLTRADFVRWSQGAQCPTCPIGESCQARRDWMAQGTVENTTPLAQGVVKNNIPLSQGVVKNSPPCPEGMLENNHKPDRYNHTDNNQITDVLISTEKSVERERRAQEETRRDQPRADRPRVLGFPARMAARYEISAELRQVWQSTLFELSLQMSEAVYRSHFPTHTALAALHDGVARIAVSNRYTEEWLAHRLNGMIEETLGRVLGKGIKLEFFTPEEE